MWSGIYDDNDEGYGHEDSKGSGKYPSKTSGVRDIESKGHQFYFCLRVITRCKFYCNFILGNLKGIISAA